MPERLQEIRARLDAATPGPWKRDRHEILTVDVDDETGWETCIADAYGDPADADLIAHAPDDLRWLLDEVERLRSES